MYIHMDRAGAVGLAEPTDFKGFRLVIDGDPAAWRDRAAGFGGLLRLDSDATAWVDEARLRALGPAGDAGWQDKLTAMLDYARGKGWVDPASGAVRAHVEWRPVP